MGVGVDNQELEPQALEPETSKLQSPRALNPATSQHALKQTPPPQEVLCWSQRFGELELDWVFCEWLTCVIVASEQVQSLGFQGLGFRRYEERSIGMSLPSKSERKSCLTIATSTLMRLPCV